jgi:hypothetical protein
VANLEAPAIAHLENRLTKSLVGRHVKRSLPVTGCANHLKRPLNHMVREKGKPAAQPRIFYVLSRELIRTPTTSTAMEQDKGCS